MVRTAGPTSVGDSVVAWRRSGTDWRRAFPEVFERGGFDVVVANPPYVRERGAKAWFDEVAATPLGRTWRRPRMDLWHYFFHRGLELLAPGGVMTLIVPSYFATAMSGAALRKRMGEETRLIELLDFADLPIFPGVQGRHLIMTVRLGHADPGDPVRLCWPQRSGRETARNAMDLEWIVEDLRVWVSSGGAGETAASWSTATVPHHDVLSAGRLALRPVTGRARGALPSGRPGTADRLTLGDLFDVRQGIAENPPRLTRTQAEQLGDGYHEGMGVFVLDAGEIAQLDLSEAERAVLRPYYLPREIGRYRLQDVSTLSLLYLTRETCPDVTAMPAVERHLSRFRSILSERREVRLGKSAWWHLHWPRKESLFIQPRILAPQMVRRPVFACELIRPTFVNFSVNVIALPGDAGKRDRLRTVVGLDDERLSLQAACGVLNSRAIEEWLARNAKQRGAALDVSGGMLRQVPWPRLAPREWAEVARLAAECGTVVRAGGETRDLESEIDRLVGPSVAGE